MFPPEAEGGSGKRGMVTYGELMTRSVRRLVAAGVPEPHFDARALAEHFLGLSLTDYLMKMNLPADEENGADPARMAAFEAAMARRERREPLQHILGEAWLMGLPFVVNTDVLVPRPDTEILIGRALDIIREWERQAGRKLQTRTWPEEQAGRKLQTRTWPEEQAGGKLHTGTWPEEQAGGRMQAGTEQKTRAACRVLDLCTGSGCIAVSLKCGVPRIVCTASDLSEQALTIARDNARRNHAGIRFVRSDLLEAFRADERFDLVVSNPPYIPTGEITGLAPEVACFDPPEALDGGPDGLEFYRRICREVPGHLAGGGALAVEIGQGQAGAVSAMLETAGFSQVRVTKDLAGLDRVVEGVYNP